MDTWSKASANVSTGMMNKTSYIPAKSRSSAILPNTIDYESINQERASELKSIVQKFLRPDTTDHMQPKPMNNRALMPLDLHNPISKESSKSNLLESIKKLNIVRKSLNPESKFQIQKSNRVLKFIPPYAMNGRRKSCDDS